MTLSQKIIAAVNDDRNEDLKKLINDNIEELKENNLSTELFQTIVQIGSVKSIEVLIASGNDIGISNEIINDFIIDLLCKKSLLKVKNLIETRNKINIYDLDLIFASRAGLTDTVKMLIEAGVNPNVTTTKCNRTALTYASGNGYTEIVRILIENGADVNITTKYNVSALMYAVEDGYTEIARMLIENGADVNIIDINWESALIIAIIIKHIEIVKMLLAAGANPNIITKDNSSALTFAIDCSQEKIAEDDSANDITSKIAWRMISIKIIKILLVNNIVLPAVLPVITNDLVEKYINSARLVDTLLDANVYLTPDDIQARIEASDSDILITRYIKKINNNISNYFDWDNDQLNELLNKILNIPLELKDNVLHKLSMIRDEFNLSFSSIIAQVYNITPFSLLEFINLSYENSEEDLSQEDSLALPTYIGEILEFYSTHSDLNYNETKALLESSTLTSEEIVSLKISIIKADIYILINNLEEIINKAFELSYFDNIENILKLEIPTEVKNVLNQAYENKCQELYEELIQEPNVETWLDMSLPTPVIIKLATEFSEYKDELEKKSQADYAKFHKLHNYDFKQNNSLEANNDNSTDDLIKNCSQLNDLLLLGEDNTQVDLVNEE